MSFTAQGGGLRPRSSSGQWVGAVWWLYTFFAIATYTANMGAFLTISRMVKDIDSYEFLAKQNRMKHAPINGSEYVEWFEMGEYRELRFYE